MIYLELSGGLGNQLFEYAMARQVLEYRRKKNPDEKIVLLLGRYDKDIRNYSLKAFNIDDNIIILPRLIQKELALYYKIKKHLLMKLNIKKSKLISGAENFRMMCRHNMMCTTDVFNYYECVIPDGKNVYIYGNFQTIKYFDEIQDILKKELTLKKECLNVNKDIFENISSSNSVAVHIRRGDYLTQQWGKSLNVCNEQYYVNAMKYIISNVSNPKFFIFSNSRDDLLWIKKNMNLPGNIVYVNQEGSEIDDFYLMSSCKYHVISNSTYSWWTSFLANSNDKIVCAPSIWYKTNDQNARDIYLENWKLIKI